MVLFQFFEINSDGALAFFFLRRHPNDLAQDRFIQRFVFIGGNRELDPQKIPFLNQLCGVKTGSMKGDMANDPFTRLMKGLIGETNRSYKRNPGISSPIRLSIS